MKQSISIRLFAGLFGVAALLFAVNAQAASTSVADASNAEATAQEEQNVPEEAKAALEDFRAGRFEDAVKKLDEARKKNPDMAPAHLVLAQWFGLANQPRAVRQAIEQAVTLNPDDPEAFVVLGELNLQNGGFTEAELLFARAESMLESFSGSDLRKSNIRKRVLLGNAQVKIARNKKDEAEKALNMVLELDAANLDALNLLGALYFNEDKIDECLATYEKVKTAQPNTLLPEARVAMMYQQKGDEDSKKKAAEYMVSAIKKAPKDGDVRMVATQWSLQVGNIKQAAAQAEAALTLKKDDKNLADAQLLRGVVALFEKDYLKAEEMFQKVLEASPSNFAASNNLALALCEQGENDPEKLRKAEEYAVVNVRQYQNQPEAFSTAAWVTYKKGDYPTAAQLLQKSIELSNGQLNPDTAYYLAATLVKIQTNDAKQAEDNKNRAKEILSKTLENTTPFSMRPEAEELLKTLGGADAPAAPAK